MSSPTQKKLEGLLKKAILAEYYARLPQLLPDNLKPGATDRMYDALEAVREELTGERGLYDAAQALGATIPKRLPVSPQKKKPKKRKRDKKRKRESKREKLDGFFG